MKQQHLAIAAIAALGLLIISGRQRAAAQGGGGGGGSFANPMSSAETAAFKQKRRAM